MATTDPVKDATWARLAQNPGAASVMGVIGGVPQAAKVAAANTSLHYSRPLASALPFGTHSDGALVRNDAPAAATTAVGAPAVADPNAPGPHFIMGATSGDPAPPTYRDTLGEQRLAPGVSRFNDPSVPGVYAARMADGSLGFSNVMGANGQPDFAGAVDPNGVTTKGLRNRMVASNAGARPGGWNSGFDPTNGTPLQAPMQRAGGGSQRLYAQMTGQGYGAGTDAVGADPRANFTYASNSLHMTPAQTSALLNETQADPAAALHLQQQLNDAMKKDPNNADPDVAAANALFADQLAGHTQEARQRFYGSGNGVYGAMGAGGGGRGGSGLNMGTLLNYNTKMAGLRERAQRDADTAQFRTGELAFRKQQLDRQQLNDLQNKFNAAETKLPGSGAALLAQVAPPPGMNQQQFEAYLNTDKGNAWQSMLNQEMQVGAGNSLRFYEWGDRRNLGQNVNWRNLDLGADGRFEGFNAEDGSGDQYPRKSAFGAHNYNDTLINSVSPAHLQGLKRWGLRRAQPVPQTQPQQEE